MEGISQRFKKKMNRNNKKNIKRKAKVGRPSPELKGAFTTRTTSLVQVNRGSSSRKVQPLSTIKNLFYEETLTNYNNPGGPIIVGTYRFNDVYDFDPLLLSRTIQFVNYMFDLYYYAKVLSATFTLTISNLEQTAIDIACFATTTNPAGLFGSRGAVEAMMGTGNLLWRAVIGEQYSNSKLTQTFSVSGQKLLGLSAQYMATQEYSCTSGASPVIPLYFSWVVMSPSATIVTGVNLEVVCKLKTLFYELRPVNTNLLRDRSKLDPEPKVEPRVLTTPETGVIKVARSTLSRQ